MLFLLTTLVLAPQDVAAPSPALNLVYEDSLAPGAEFPLGDERFWFSDRSEWSYVDSVADNGLGAPVPESGPALSFKSTKSYRPRVRSPHSLALLRGHALTGDFAFEVEAMQTGIETPHRDLVLVFGFESPEQFYYCHLGASPDANSSNIFEVNEAPRRRVGEISTKTIEWGRGEWHKLRVECTTKGNVRVFIDGAKKPHFEEELGRNPAGLIGVGSFDDAGAFRNLKVYTSKAKALPWDPSSAPPTGAGRYWMTSPFGGVVTLNSGWGTFALGRSNHRLISVDDGEWAISSTVTAKAAASAVHLPLTNAYVSRDRLGVEPVLNPGGAFEAPYRFRVGPAKQSRSSFLADDYNRKSNGHPAQGPWTWTTDGFTSTDEERPTLVANTPHGSPESWRWDEELFANAQVAERLARDFVLRRVDYGTILPATLVPVWGHGPQLVMWVAGSGPSGGRLGTTTELTTPASLLEWLDETKNKTPVKVRYYRHGAPFYR